MKREPDINNEVGAAVAGAESPERKWLLVHNLLNKYKTRDDFCELRRRICRVMIDQERKGRK